MKIDMTQVLRNYDGKPMKERTEEGEERQLTLRSVCCTALMLTPESEKASPNAEKRILRFLTAQDIFKQDEVALSSEQIVELKKLINECFQTPVVASASMLLDPQATKRK